MFLFILQQVVIWSIVIFVGHYIYNYIKDLYSVQKVNDLVYQPQKDYKKMYETIYQNKSNHQEDYNEFKNQLRDYFKKLKHKN